MDSIDFDCKICAGINNEGCKLCYNYGHVFDQATKTCKNGSVPGIVSQNTSGWTKTTYPVETFTPCDASKNEGAIPNTDTGKLVWECSACRGVVELIEKKPAPDGADSWFCKDCMRMFVSFATIWDAVAKCCKKEEDAACEIYIPGTH
jgi:hypothetical protein